MKEIPMSANRGRLFQMTCDEDEEQHSPLGLTRSGRPVWPIRGAEPDDSDDDDSDDDDDDEDDDTDSGGDDKSKKAKKDKADEDDDDDELAQATARAARYREKMRLADRRATEAERKLREAQEAKDKGDGGDESLKPKLEEASKQVETLQSENTTLRLQNAFLLNNKFAWHDPEDVMALVLKDEDVEIDDESGEVHGMEAALKRIAKKKPWMVKPDAKQDDDEDDDDEEDDDDDKPEARRRTNPSGGAQNRRRTKKGGADRQKVLQTYPALNRR
jgi:hypothetical protein